MTTVLVTEGNGILKLRTVPNAFGILAKGVSHCMVQVLEQKDTQMAHLAKIYVSAKKLRGFTKGEGVATGI